MSSWVWAGVLLALGRVPASQPQLTLTVSLGQVLPMPPVQLRAMREEASAIWRRQGVSLFWVTGDSFHRPRRPQVTLIVVDESAKETGRPVAGEAPLGYITLFEGDVSVETRISVSVDAVSALVEAGPWLGRDVLALPAAIRQRLVGQALGRVLAHEIGHYLLAWRNHVDRGLMRASFSRRLLMDSDRTPFDVTAFFVPRLQYRLRQLGGDWSSPRYSLSAPAHF